MFDCLGTEFINDLHLHSEFALTFWMILNKCFKMRCFIAVIHPISSQMSAVFTSTGQLQNNC